MGAVAVHAPPPVRHGPVQAPLRHGGVHHVVVAPLAELIAVPLRGEGGSRCRGLVADVARAAGDRRVHAVQHQRRLVRAVRIVAGRAGRLGHRVVHVPRQEGRRVGLVAGHADRRDGGLQQADGLVGAMRAVAGQAPLLHRAVLEPGLADRFAKLLVTAEAQRVAFRQEVGGVLGGVGVVALLALPVGHDLVGALRVRRNDVLVTAGADLARVCPTAAWHATTRGGHGSPNTRRSAPACGRTVSSVSDRNRRGTRGRPSSGPAPSAGRGSAGRGPPCAVPAAQPPTRERSSDANPWLSPQLDLGSRRKVAVLTRPHRKRRMNVALEEVRFLRPMGVVAALAAHPRRVDLQVRLAEGCRARFVTVRAQRSGRA